MLQAAAAAGYQNTWSQ